MNKIIRNTALAALFVVPLWIGGCNKDNDFYEVGRQPVTLTRPAIDTVIVLNHEHPDSLYTFAWSSRRHFIDYKLRFGLDEQFTTSCEQNPGVSDSWRLSTMQLDSVLSSMNVAIGATVKLYWTVEVVDPEVGWCDEVPAADRHALRTPDRADPAPEPCQRGEDRPRQENPRSRGRLRMGVPLDRPRLHAAHRPRRRAFRRRDDDRGLPIGDLARLHHAGIGRLAGGAGYRTECRNPGLLAGNGHRRPEQPDREQRRAHGHRPARHERPGGADARRTRDRRRAAARRGKGRRSGEIRVGLRHDGNHVHPAAPRRRIRQERDLQHGRNDLLRDFAGRSGPAAGTNLRHGRLAKEEIHVERDAERRGVRRGRRNRTDRLHPALRGRDRRRSDHPHRRSGRRNGLHPRLCPQGRDADYGGMDLQRPRGHLCARIQPQRRHERLEDPAPDGREIRRADPFAARRHAFRPGRRPTSPARSIGA